MKKVLKSRSACIGEKRQYIHMSHNSGARTNVMKFLPFGHVMSYKGSFTNYVDKFLGFFDHPIPSGNILYLINVD